MGVVWFEYWEIKDDLDIASYLARKMLERCGN